MLKLVKRDDRQQPGARLPEETSGEYALFLAWLTSTPRPTPEAQEIATANLWAKRAQEFDALSQKLSSPADRTTRIIENLLRTMDLEAEKLARAAAQTPTRVMGVKELVSLGAYLSQAGETLRTLLGNGGGASLAGLSLEKLEEIDKVVEMLDDHRKAL